MPKATYSEKLLTDIRNGTWREAELDLSDQSPELDEEATQTLANTLITNPYIKSLNINSNRIYAEGAKALAQNTTLTSLDVGYNNIGAEGTKALAQNTTLTSLNVSANNIGAAGAASLAQNTTLTSLHVSYNGIGAEGAKALAQNTTLTSLDVSINNIGAEGAKALAQNTTLTSLDVSYNGIGAEGAKALAKNTTLTSLDVGYNNIGAEGTKALAQNTTLTSLDVGGDGISDTDKETIAARIKSNVKKRDNWFRLVPTLAFVRANRTNAFRTSVLPLIPAIASQADKDYQDKQPHHINLDKFFDTRFFKQQISEEKDTWWSKRKPAISADAKSEKVSANAHAMASAADPQANATDEKQATASKETAFAWAKEFSFEASPASNQKSEKTSVTNSASAVAMPMDISYESTGTNAPLVASASASAATDPTSNSAFFALPKRDKKRTFSSANSNQTASAFSAGALAKK
jgi:hypothetical protein